MVDFGLQSHLDTSFVYGQAAVSTTALSAGDPGANMYEEEKGSLTATCGAQEA